MDPYLLDLPVNIETDRLKIEPLYSQHSEEFSDFQKTSEKEFNIWLAATISKLDLKESEAKRYLQQNKTEFHAREKMRYVAFNKETNTMVAILGFHSFIWDIPKANIFYGVRTGQTSKGYATEVVNVMTRYAFNIFKLKKLEIRVATINPASAKVPKKLNFKYNGLLPKEERGNDGQLWDIEVFSVLDIKSLPPLNSYSWE